MTNPPRYLTPPELAKLWHVKAGTILAMLRSGRLRGFNVGSGRLRPRYRIPPEALIEFQQQQSAKPPPPVARRRRKPDPDVIAFF